MTGGGTVRWRPLTPPPYTLVLCWLLPFLVLLATWLVAVFTGHPMEDLTRDPAAVLVMPPYLGLLSNIGVLLWGAAAAVSLFVAGLLLRAGRRDDPVQFLGLFGLLSAVLMTDDMFMLHEWVFPLVLGLPPWLPIVGEAIMLALLLIHYRMVYAQGNLFFLASALGGFGLSVALDFLPEGVLPHHYFFEDGFKFLGIANWLAFAVQTSSRAVVVAGSRIVAADGTPAEV